MGKKGKKAQAGALTIVLIILIIIVVIAILWNVLVPLIKEKTEKVEFGQFSINLEIKEVVVFENGVSIISVKRGTGQEELEGLKFVFYDEQRNSVTRDGARINELETKSYFFSAIDESGFGRIIRVGVAPIINKDLGMVVESEPESVLKIPSNVISGWKFDNSLVDFIGENDCQQIEDDYDCGNNSNFDFTNQMAISFWVEGDEEEEDKTLISKGENYKVELDKGFVKFVSASGFGESEEGLIDDWNHIVVSIDIGGVSKIYINAQEKVISINSLVKSSDNLIINNELKDVMIFDSPITKIKGLYNNQNKRE